jgi:hypothetical protein
MMGNLKPFMDYVNLTKLGGTRWQKTKGNGNHIRLNSYFEDFVNQYTLASTLDSGISTKKGNLFQDNIDVQYLEQVACVL